MNQFLHCVEDHRLVIECDTICLRLKKLEKLKMQEFIAERTESNAKFIYAPIQKNKLQMFFSLRVSKQMKVSGTIVTVQSSYQVFSWFMVTQSQQVSIRVIVESELRPVPWALAKLNGEMCSIPKSKVIKVIKSEVSLVSSLPKNTVTVFDAMVIKTFGDVSDQLLSTITKQSSQVVFFINDHYDCFCKKPGKRSKSPIWSNPARHRSESPSEFQNISV